MAKSLNSKEDALVVYNHYSKGSRESAHDNNSISPPTTTQAMDHVSTRTQTETSAGHCHNAIVKSPTGLPRMSRQILRMGHYTPHFNMFQNEFDSRQQRRWYSATVLRQKQTPPCVLNCRSFRMGCWLPELANVNLVLATRLVARHWTQPATEDRRRDSGHDVVL